MVLFYFTLQSSLLWTVLTEGARQPVSVELETE